MTGPGVNPPSGGDRNKRVDVGGADAVPDTPRTAKPQGAEPNADDRRRTPRGTTTAPTEGGIKPVVWIVLAIVVIAALYFALGRG